MTETDPTDLSGPIFDPTYTPPRYAPLQANASGAWRPVLEGGQPVGAIWTDYMESAGVTWVRQTAGIDRLIDWFTAMKQGGFDGAVAYRGASTLEDVTLGDEQRGGLSEMRDFVNELDGVPDAATP